MKGIKRYAEVLSYILSYHTDHKVMPSLKQIEYDLNIKRGSLCRVLAALVELGYLKACHQMPYRLKL